MSDTFTYHGEELPYFDHLYNLTMLNERRVELAVVWNWLRGKHWAGGLEVGNVTGHYQEMTHAVVDLHEEPAWYQRKQQIRAFDILDWQTERKFPWVISISTIEHTEDPIKALEVLRDLVDPGGELLVTFPTGVHDDLDELVKWCDQTFDRWCTMARGGPPGHPEEWYQTAQPVVRPYGPWANSVFIGEWSRPE